MKMGNLLKKTAAVALVCTSVAFFTACDGGSKQTVTIAHTQIETHPDHIGMIAFKNYIESKLGKKYEVLIYPEARLGSNESLIKQIKDNQVQYLVVSSANLESFDNLYSIFSLPYLFTNETIFEKFITSPKVIEMLNMNSDRNKFTPVVAFTSGTRNFYSKTPIKNLLDLQNKRIRVQAGPVNIAMVLAFGARPVPMAFNEVYTALENNVIDGAENNEFALIDQKHGKLAKYYTYDRHQMCPDFLVASTDFLAQLPKEDAKIFAEAAAEAQKAEFVAWHNQIAIAKQESQKLGVEFIEIDIKPFKDKVLPLHHQILEEEDPNLKALYQHAVNFEQSELNQE